MKKPRNYEETQAQRDWRPIALGGHKLVIRQVNEAKSKTGKNMIVVLFDFAEDDHQPNYFMNQYIGDNRQDKKWSNQATQYILTEDTEGVCTRNFKTFITCVERSNAGFEVQWGDKFCQCFKGKRIGGVFGEQMDYYNGEEKKKRVLRWFCSIEKAEDAVIPDISETKAYKEWKQNSGSQNSDGFMSIPDNVDELPFNM